MNPQIIPLIILTGHWIIMIWLSTRVIMRKPPVGVALAWLTVIFSVPYIGSLTYLLFGEKRLGGQRADRIESSIAGVTLWQAQLSAKYGYATETLNSDAKPLALLSQAVRGFPALPNNSVELLDNTHLIFDRIIQDINNAKTSIDLSFYIWFDGGRVEEVVDALVCAATRGVKCRALADALGSKLFLRRKSCQRLREAGVVILAAMPTGAIRMLFARTDLRNHRKILVIDEVIAYAGSLNLVDPKYFKKTAGVGEWVDAMVRVCGPVATCLQGVFELDWSIENGQSFDSPSSLRTNNLGQSFGASDSIAQVIPSGPDKQPQAIHKILLASIYAAQNELILTTPYFVPDDAILTALVSAAQRGVAVTLIVPKRSDSLLVRNASVAHFDDLLSSGVNIALFKGGLLHTKSLTIDGEICLFGSVNLDMRSLWLNFEISVIFYDAELTRMVRSLQQRYLQEADLVDLIAWRKRPTYKRFVSNVCRLLGPLL